MIVESLSLGEKKRAGKLSQFPEAWVCPTLYAIREFPLDFKIPHLGKKRFQMNHSVNQIIFLSQIAWSKMQVFLKGEKEKELCLP